MALRFIASGHVTPPEEVAPIQPVDPPDSFQAWRTPDSIFEALNQAFGPFGLDAAADAENTRCLLYLDESRDALCDTTRWSTGSPDGAVWCNPPYRKVMAWLKRARLAVAMGECGRVVLLLNAEPGTKWFNLAVLEHEVQLFAGRIKFDLPPGMKNYRRPAKSQCVVVVEKDGLAGVTAIRDARDGTMIHDLLERPASA